MRPSCRFPPPFDRIFFNGVSNLGMFYKTKLLCLLFDGRLMTMNCFVVGIDTYNKGKILIKSVMMFHRWLILFLSFMVTIACDGPEVKKGRFLLKGNVRMQENDYPGAREFYDEALKIDGEFADAYYNRGITYQIIGSYQQAIEDFTKAISFRDGYSDAYYQRGLAYFDNGEYYKSLEDAGYLI